MLYLVTFLALIVPLIGIGLISWGVLTGARRLRSKNSKIFCKPYDGKHWLMYRSLSLPALFILPFFFNHFKQFVCPNPSVYAGPCYQIDQGAFGWLGLLVIIFSVIMLFSVRATWKKGKERIEFARKQLYYALAAVIFTSILYGVLYYFSQGRQLNLLPEFQPASQSTIDYIQSKPLGVSFPPSFLLVYCLIYLAPPIWQVTRMTKDKSRVAGVKKKELFQ